MPLSESNSQLSRSNRTQQGYVEGDDFLQQWLDAQVYEARKKGKLFKASIACTAAALFLMVFSFTVTPYLVFPALLIASAGFGIEIFRTIKQKTALPNIAHEIETGHEAVLHKKGPPEKDNSQGIALKDPEQELKDPEQDSVFKKQNKSKKFSLILSGVGAFFSVFLLTIAMLGPVGPVAIAAVVLVGIAATAQLARVAYLRYKRDESLPDKDKFYEYLKALDDKHPEIAKSLREDMADYINRDKPVENVLELIEEANNLVYKKNMRKQGGRYYNNREGTNKSTAFVKELEERRSRKNSKLVR